MTKICKHLAQLGVLSALVFIGRPANALNTTAFTYHAGQILQPYIVPLYWGTFTQTQIQTYQSFLQNLAVYMSGGMSPQGQEPTIAQYGVRGAVIGPYYYDHTNLPPIGTDLGTGMGGCTTGQGSEPCTTVSGIQSEIALLQSQGHLPSFASSPELFIVVITNDMLIADMGPGVCAFHQSANPGEWAIVPSDTGCGPGTVQEGFESMLTHEIFEGSSNPNAGGWYGSTGELGDGCESQPKSFPWGYVQGIWDSLQYSSDDTVGCTVWTTEQASSISAVQGPNSSSQVSLSALASNHSIVYNTNPNGGAWQAPVNLGATATAAPVSIVVGEGTLQVFVQGLNNGLWHNSRTAGGQWQSGWDNLGGVFAGQPAVVSGVNVIDIFVMGMDGHYYHASWNGGAWGGLAYTAISNTVFNGPPTVVAIGSKEYIFGRGINGTYFVSTWNGTTFTPFDDTPFLADVYISDPVVTIFTDGINGPNGEIDVFGQGTDWAYYHRSFIKGSWGRLDGVAGFYVGPPALLGHGATSPGVASELIVFGESIDQGFYWSANSTGYAPWSPDALYSNGAGFGAAALVSTNGASPLNYAFVEGSDHAIWVEHQSPNKFTQASWSTWTSIGNSLH